MRQIQSCLTTCQILFLCLFGSPFEVQAGRPLSTDDAGVVEVGTLELEHSFTFVDAVDDEYNLSTVITTGVLNRVDIGVEIPYQFINSADDEDQNGLSDIGVTTKWQVYATDSLASALSFHYKSDNGNDENGLGSGEPEFTILGIVSKQFSDFTVHFNFGPTIIREQEDSLNYLIASEWSINERTTFVAEVIGATTYTGGFDDNLFSGLVGLTYTLSEHMVFDAGLNFGIAVADPDLSVTGGVTIAFGN